MDLSTITWDILGQAAPLAIALAAFMQFMGKDAVDMLREGVLCLIALIKHQSPNIPAQWGRRGWFYNLATLLLGLAVASFFHRGEPFLASFWVAAQAAMLSIGGYELVKNTVALRSTDEDKAAALAKQIAYEALGPEATPDTVMFLTGRLTKALQALDVKWH
jgi:hypothetical protein